MTTRVGELPRQRVRAATGDFVARANSVPLSALDVAPWLSKYPRRSEAQTLRYQRLKQWLDPAIVILAMPLWLPVCLMIYISLKICDPHAPGVYRQSRTGLWGARIRVLKFRTMVKNAEELKASLLHLNERVWPDFKIAHDPRVTRLGRLLRATSLDELPQLGNVLRGNMSLVGPRPITLRAETLTDWHLHRFNCRPGLTGVWQVAGRQCPSLDERLRLDFAYMQRQCLRLDIELVLRTLTSVLQRDGE